MTKMKKVLSILSVGLLAFSLAVVSSSASNADDESVNINELISKDIDLKTGAAPFNVAISPDSSIVVVSNFEDSNKPLSFYKLDKNKDVINSGWVSSVGGNLYDVSFSPDGKILAATSRTLNKVFIFDVEINGSLILKSAINVGINPFDLSFSPDGQLLAVSSENDNKVSIFKINKDNNFSLETELIQNQFSQPRGIAFSPNGNLFAVANLAANNIVIYEVSADYSFVEISEISSTAPRSISFSKDSKTIASVNMTQNGTVSIFRIAKTENDYSITLVNELSVGDTPYRVKFSPNGKILVVTNAASNNISVFKFNENWNIELLGTFSTGTNPYGLAFSKDSRTLLSTNFYDDSFSIYSVNYSLLNVKEFKGLINLNVESSISLTIDDTDDSILLKEIPGAENVTDIDNQMTYVVTSNNLEGYNVTIQADQEELLPSDTETNFDSIPVSLLTIEQPDTETNGTSTGVQTLSHTSSKLLYSQNERSNENGDSFTSLFSLTEVPFVNADDYSGTVTYTATVN